MEAFIIYLLKASIWIAVFWMIYRVFLRSEPFFRFNRVFLLTGLAAAFPLALCHRTYYIDINYQPVMMVYDSPVMETYVAAEQFDRTGFMLAAGYLSAVILIAAYHLLGLWKIWKMIRRNAGNHTDIIDIKGIKSSFSLFGYIFMDMQSGMSEMEKTLILEHEKAHIRQKHYIDTVVAQVVCALLWFNPFAWVYLAAVKQNHEFLADHSVLKHGYSRAVYNAALINNTFKIPIFAFTNSFTYYKLKRIKMMKKIESNRAKKLAVLLIAPALLAFSWAFAKPEYRYNVSFGADPATNSSPEDGVAYYTDDLTAAPDTVKVEFFEDRLKSSNTNINLGGSTRLAFKKYSSGMIINGKVRDKRGKPIQGAVIIFDDINTGVVSDADGNFTLHNPKVKVDYRMPPGAVELAYNDPGIDPVDTTPFGIKDFEGKPEPLILLDGQEISLSIYKELKSDDIAGITIFKDKSAVKIYGDRGKNGVIVVTTGKASGKGTVIKDSGIAPVDPKDFMITDSPGKPQPLILLDGQAAPSEMLLYLKPDDIESFTVLKDKEATELYGERGKNGVINVILKKNADGTNRMKTTTNQLYVVPSGPTGYPVKMIKDEGVQHGVIDKDKTPLYLIDKKVVSSLDNLRDEEVHSFYIYRGKTEATAPYGDKGDNGVISVITRKYAVETGDTIVPQPKPAGESGAPLNVLRQPSDEQVKNLTRRVAEVITKNITQNDDDIKEYLRAASLARKNHTFGGNPPLILIDGEEVKSEEDIRPEEIQYLQVHRGEIARKLYGEKGKNGALVITTRPRRSRGTIALRDNVGGTVSTPLSTSFTIRDDGTRIITVLDTIRGDVSATTSDVIRVNGDVSAPASAKESVSVTVKNLANRSGIFDADAHPLILIDRKEAKSLDKLQPEEIYNLSVYKSETETAKPYGKKAKDGLISILTKKYAFETGDTLDVRRRPAVAAPTLSKQNHDILKSWAVDIIEAEGAGKSEKGKAKDAKDAEKKAEGAAKDAERDAKKAEGIAKIAERAAKKAELNAILSEGSAKHETSSSATTHFIARLITENSVRDNAIFRGNTDFGDKSPLIFIDRIEVKSSKEIKPEDIHSITVHTGIHVIKLYGEKARHGAVFIFSKKYAKENGDFVTIPNSYKTSSDLLRSKQTMQEIISGGNASALYYLNGYETEYAAIQKVNPDQIENVSVLKDQTAVEVYGERGHKGVVIITTKPKA